MMNLNREKLPTIAAYEVPADLKCKVVYTACIDGKPFDFVTSSNAKIARRVEPIINKVLAGMSISAADRYLLLNAVYACLHESGKVEGAASVNSCCKVCKSCVCRMGDENKICSKCYSDSQSNWQAGTREKGIISAWIINSIVFTPDEWKNLAILHYGFVIRVESFGDCSSVNHAANMINIALAYPEKRVGIWTKNPAYYEKIFDQIGKPENVSFGYSAELIAVIPEISGKSWYKYIDFVFAVMLPNGKSKNTGLTLDGQVVPITCGGKKCKTCANHGKDGYSCYFLRREDNNNEPYMVYEMLK